MEKVFLVWHVRVISEEDDTEDIKLIGIYTTEKLAEEAIERKKMFEGFRDFPEGFEISENPLNQDLWSEGFITIEEAIAAIKEDEK
jgi:hypothetical protein